MLRKILRIGAIVLVVYILAEIVFALMNTGTDIWAWVKANDEVTTLLKIFVICLTVVILVYVVAKKCGRKSRSARKSASKPTLPDETADKATPPAPTLARPAVSPPPATASSGSKGGFKLSFWTVVVPILAVVIIYNIFTPSPEQSQQQRAVASANNGIGVRNSETPSQRHEPIEPAPSLADFAPRSTTTNGRFKPLAVYRDHEVMLPPETKYATLKTRNTTDVFIIRGELNGKSVGSWTYRGEVDVVTPFPKADTWYIKCTNRDVTWVDFVGPR